MSPPPPVETHLLYRDLRGRKPDIVAKAKGSYLTLTNGARILDACAGAAVASIGHGDQRVIDAICSQLQSISYHHTSRMINDSAEELATLLLEGNPGGLSHAIFLGSGSEANETALKLVRQYWVEKGEPERVYIIARHNSYHGNSTGAMSLTGLEHRRRAFEPLLNRNIHHVSPCYPYRQKLEGESDADYSQRLADELEAKILELGAGTVGAFFAETVGGAASGNLTPVPGYFQAIRKVCDKYGVLLVLDEVMAGIGRTGKMHAWEWEGVFPDIQTNAKGINGGYQNLSAVLMQQFIVDTLKAGSGAFTNGHTFQNHAPAAAACVAVLNIIKSDKVIENCVARGEQLLNGLKARLSDHPHVGDIRGRGLFLSIEFVLSKSTKSVFPASLPLAALLDDAIFNRGVAIYSGFGKGTVDGIVGDHILLSPPLTISEAEVDELLDAVVGGVEEVFTSDRVREVSAGTK